MTAPRSGPPDPADLVDLQRYPLLDLDGPAGRALVDRSRAAMAADGACELLGFLTADGLEACVDDAVALAPAAHRSHGATTPYLEQPSPDWAEDHPRAQRLPFSLGAVAYDQFPASSPIRAVYEWEPLLRFVAAVLDRGEVFRYADPLGALNLAVMDDGDVLGWHFDQTDFVVSIALQSSERGGHFECAELIRTAHDEQYERVAAVMDGDPEGRVRVVAMEPGTLLLFAGRRSLHRVSTVEGDRARHVALLGYDTASGTRSSESLQRVRYGRVA